MLAYHPIPTPLLHLFLLTLQVKGKLSNAYSMGESVDDAYARYLARIARVKGNVEGIQFVDGGLADPHAHLHS